jgi:hypothetical protein
MMNEVSPRPKRPARRSDPKVLSRFVEELAWFLSSYDDVDFKALADFATEQREIRNRSVHLASRVSKSDTTVMLVGILPSLFMDVALFPSNEDLVDFARYALGIDTPRWSKKSKNELIGHIVCHANLAPTSKVNRLLTALEGLVDEHGSVRKKVKDQRRLGLSWNEVIQNLVQDIK